MLEGIGKFFTVGERVRQARAKIENLERRRLALGVLKPRHQTELDMARGVTRRHMLKLIGLGAASVGIPGLAVSLASKSDDPTAVPPENSELRRLFGKAVKTYCVLPQILLLTTGLPF